MAEACPHCGNKVYVSFSKRPVVVRAARINVETAKVMIMKDIPFDEIAKVFRVEEWELRKVLKEFGVEE